MMEQSSKRKWCVENFGDSNPYEDLPEMRIFTYDLGESLGINEYEELEDKAFNFKEFFRTWTGEKAKDHKEMPTDAKIGDFVHEEDIKSFLDLITRKDVTTNYPYSSKEYREFFKHSLWLLPGVKEARALSTLLKQHHIFGCGQFEIVNIAGDGDEEDKTEEALTKVRTAINKALKYDTYKNIKSIYDYEKSTEFFPTVHIDGGICYFLWKHNHNDKCEFHYKDLNGFEDVSFRYLKNDVSDTVIRDSRQISIIEKALSKNEDKFSDIVSSRKPYGIATDLFNDPKKYNDLDLIFSPKTNYLKIYGVKGNKGGAKRIVGYISNDKVKIGRDSINKYKLFFSYAYSTGATVPPEIIIGKPNEIATETFLQIGCFDTEIYT